MHIFFIEALDKIYDSDACPSCNDYGNKECSSQGTGKRLLAQISTYTGAIINYQRLQPSSQ